MYKTGSSAATHLRRRHFWQSGDSNESPSLREIEIINWMQGAPGMEDGSSKDGSSHTQPLVAHPRQSYGSHVSLAAKIQDSADNDDQQLDVFAQTELFELEDGLSGPLLGGEIQDKSENQESIGKSITSPSVEPRSIESRFPENPLSVEPPSVEPIFNNGPWLTMGSSNNTGLAAHEIATHIGEHSPHNQDWGVWEVAESAQQNAPKAKQQVEAGAASERLREIPVPQYRYESSDVPDALQELTPKSLKASQEPLAEVSESQEGPHKVDSMNPPSMQCVISEAEAFKSGEDQRTATSMDPPAIKRVISETDAPSSQGDQQTAESKVPRSVENVSSVSEPIPTSPGNDNPTWREQLCSRWRNSFRPHIRPGYRRIEWICVSLKSLCIR